MKPARHLWVAGMCLAIGAANSASAETLTASGLAIGCADKGLFRELMIIAAHDKQEFLAKALDHASRGNCRFFDDGQKVVIEERDPATTVLVRVHEFGDVGSYWTSRTFFAAGSN